MTKEERAEYKVAYNKRNRTQIAAKKRAYRVANKEKIQAQKRAYYITNSEKICEKVRAYQAANPEKVREKNRAYRAANPKQSRAAVAAWKRRNSHKCAAINHKYRAAKLYATPSWATATVGQYVESLALRRSSTQHIDHTVPLIGKLHSNHPIQLVCGLHAENNLQLIAATENMSKGCREWPDMWDYTATHMTELELLCSTTPPIALGMKAYV